MRAAVERQSGVVERALLRLIPLRWYRVEQLQKLDRYECRALSRRTRAFCNLARLPRSTRR
jgi:hypothetical protein